MLRHKTSLKKFKVEIHQASFTKHNGIKLKIKVFGFMLPANETKVGPQTKVSHNESQEN